MDLVLSTRCPQCGAEISFDEESTVIRCAFCGSALRLVGRSGVTQTYVAPREDFLRTKKAIQKAFADEGLNGTIVSEKRLFYAPYWRVKGMVFRWVFGRNLRGEQIKELKTKNLDVTFPAYEGVNLGLRSLGLRPSALKLRFFDRSEMSKRGAILEVGVTLKDACGQVTPFTHVGLDEVGLKISHDMTRLVGQRYTIVYFPFWMIRVTRAQDSRVLILDGAANTLSRVFTADQWQETMAGASNRPVPISFSEVFFVPFKCPNCGWELALNRFDIIHLCRTCHRAWMERAGRLGRVSFEVARPLTPAAKDFTYLPFWVYQAEIASDGHILRTGSHLLAFSRPYAAGMPSGAGGAPVRFFVPAMGIRNVPAVNRLAAGVTQSQPAFGAMPADCLEDARLMGVALSPRAAMDMGEVLLWSLTPQSRGEGDRFLERAVIQIKKMRLIWWPFSEQRLFLRDAICGCGIQKGALIDFSEQDATQSSETSAGGGETRRSVFAPGRP